MSRLVRTGPRLLGWSLAAVSLVLVFAAGCGRRAVGPLPQAPPPPPGVEAVYPPARARGIAFDTPIWVQFTQPLDPLTVNDRTVFVKLDTQRLPITVGWNPTARRIEINLQVPLALKRTYTVELSPAITGADNIALGETFFWQFTTISLRRPDPIGPVPGIANESPYAPLVWRSTEASAGTTEYDVYVGDDSAMVAARAVPRLARVRTPYLMPGVQWDFGSSHYWAISVDNLDTGDRSDGNVAGFTVVTAGAPIDSFVVDPQDWGDHIITSPTRQTRECNGTNFQSNPNGICAIRFRLSQAPQNLRLAGAYAQLYATSTSQPNLPAEASVWVTISPWTGCTVEFPAVPLTEQVPIATGTLLPPNLIRFNSGALITFLQTAIRVTGPDGFVLRTNRGIVWFSPTVKPNATRVGMMLYYYK